jgi:hypothetical protein
MRKPQAAVLGTGVWLPGFPDLNAWLAGSAGEEVPPSGAIIERRSRRRSSQFTRALSDSYEQALSASGLEPSEVASVFGSALGEVSTMVGLLDQMWRETGPLSPMAFAMSVHNAAAGVVSISTANRGYTTSSGADFDTPAMGLVEAFGLLDQGASVLVVVGDESVPEKLVRGDVGWCMLTAAIALGPVTSASDSLAVIELPSLEPGNLERADLSSPASRNPCAGMLDLIDAIHRHDEGRVALDRGRGRGWSASLSFG